VPRRDGLEFLGGFHALESVAEQDPDVPRILYTDVVNPDIARESVSLGLFDYIPATTDGSLDRLVSRVRAATAKRRAERTITDLSRVNEVIREVLTVVVRAERRAEVWEGVTSTLVATDAYDSAWVGRIEDGVRTLSAAGEKAGTDEATVAAMVDAADGAVACPPPVGRAGDPNWRGAVVSLTDDGTTLVVFTERPGGFDDRERDVLAQLGETVRYATEAIAARETLAEREQTLAAKTERLSKFASVVSHDLRNPLSVARGNLELAMNGETERLPKVESAPDRLDGIIDDVLALAREGERSVDPEPVSLRAVVTDAWRTAETESSRLTPPEDVVVRADRSQLTRLFENRFRNAVEHGSTSPASQARHDTVEQGATGERSADAPDVRVERQPDGFTVDDDGPGIPESDRPELFDAGFTTARHGTGFGLAIVSDIAAAHGWTVRVGESPMEGARFAVTGVEFES